ncbi:helix-turn-helix transcriptional regulator [Bacillus cereus]|nr:helix-turn-helix transcriptional regulator [Bacillus cereus]
MIKTIKRVDLDKIKRIRKEMGFSIEVLSDNLGYKSINGYYYLEKGRNKFSAEALARVADTLGVPISDPFFDEYITDLAIKKNSLR